jgi:ribosomal protein S5
MNDAIPVLPSLRERSTAILQPARSGTGPEAGGFCFAVLRTRGYDAGNSE